MSVNTSDLRNQLSKRDEKKPMASNSVKALLESPSVKKRFEQILDKRAPQYMSSIVNLVTSDTNLSKCDPMTVIGSAMVAATLDLPIDKNLGYAWVIPYGTKANFQLGYKGYIQLALRTGQYKYINVIEVYEGELVSFNRLTEEIVFDQSQKASDAVIGYAAYFELLNGFKKTIYWTKEEVERHRDRFSKGAKRTDSPWNTDFNTMAMKTVLKNLLSKWGILSIEMQKAFNTDDNTTIYKDSHGSDDGDFYDIQPLDETIIDDAPTSDQPGADNDQADLFTNS